MIYQTIRAKWGNNFISIQGNLANQCLSNFVAERAARYVIYQTIRAKWGNNFISIQGNLANQSLSNFVSEGAAQRDLPNNTCKMG